MEDHKVQTTATDQGLPALQYRDRQDDMQVREHHSLAVIGLPLANVTADEAVGQIERLILSGGTHQVSTANLDFWLNSLKDNQLHRIIADCSLVLPDGMPLVWISRLLGSSLKERVSGADLVPMLAQLSARKGYRIYLLGGRPGVAERATELLEARYPGVQIVGHHAPPMADLDRMDHGDTLERIHAAKPDILMVAFGNPKQEKWIKMHARTLRVPVAIGIGGSMDMLVGDVRRSPGWMQRNGLEWLGRCVQEPSRLVPRYSRNMLGLVTRLPLAWTANLLQRRQTAPSVVNRTSESGIVHLQIQGNLNAETTGPLDQAVRACMDGGKLLVVNFAGLKYADAVGLGALLDARQRLLANGLSLTLANVPWRIRMLLSALCMLPLFDELMLEHGAFALGNVTHQSPSFADLVGKDSTLPTKSEG
jgi:N-acetylglucosaminyldiphosphoundecaprenol N-acetyl-beta-D-mannosaminyltransferase